MAVGGTAEGKRVNSVEGGVASAMDRLSCKRALVGAGGAVTDRLTSIINEWDPINVMSHALDDEYELEVSLIRRLLRATSEEHTLAEGIAGIFLETCGRESFRRSRGECLTVARTILGSAQ